jgi:hypothetical protein
MNSPFLPPVFQPLTTPLQPYLATAGSQTAWRSVQTPKPFTTASLYQLSPSGLPAKALGLVRDQNLHLKFGDFDDHLEDVAIGVALFPDLRETLD